MFHGFFNQMGTTLQSMQINAVLLSVEMVHAVSNDYITMWKKLISYREFTILQEQYWWPTDFLYSSGQLLVTWIPIVMCNLKLHVQRYSNYQYFWKRAINPWSYLNCNHFRNGLSTGSANPINNAIIQVSFNFACNIAIKGKYFLSHSYNRG